MSRSLAWFLVFVAALAVGGALGAWLLGPSVVSLAFDEERRNAPYYLLHLVGAVPDGRDTREFRRELAELVVADGGRLLWPATTIQVAEGRVEDEWRDLQLFEFDRGGDLVEMLTSASYRELTARHAPTTNLVLGTDRAPDAIAAGGAVLLNLYAVNEAATDEFVSAARELSGSLASESGRLLWDAPLTGLEGEVPWTHVLLFAFDDVKAAEDWLRDPATITRRTLVKRGATLTVTLILRSA